MKANFVVIHNLTEEQQEVLCDVCTCAIYGTTAVAPIDEFCMLDTDFIATLDSHEVTL